MHPTLRDLLASPQLQLSTLVDGDPAKTGAPLTWVHGSDLDDPTRFLEAGNVVLTTGTQFLVDAGPLRYRDYVVRLAHAGVPGIGFGTEVVAAGTPPELVEACASAGMPLFEVPLRVPFIAVARFAADLISQAAHARDTWALGAQRAISRAALRTDAMGSVVEELSHQLGRWVALFDQAGRVSHAAGRLPDALGTDEVTGEVQRLLSRGQRASSTVEHAGTSLVVQTLGHRSRLRGAIAIAGAGIPDPADQSVVTGVVALAELSLEQGRALDAALHGLRSAQLRALLVGRVDLAGDIARSRDVSLPGEPIRVAVVRPEAAKWDAVLSGLGVREKDGSLFYSLHDDEIVICLPGDDRAAAERLAEAYGIAIGLSNPVPYTELAEGISQAERAVEGAPPASVRRFSEVARHGIAALLDRAESSEIARATLAPVIAHDAEYNGHLLRSASAWLEHNGQWDPAARELGIHRHTLRARITQLERLMGTSLDSFEARANLWLALRTLER